MKSFKEIMRGMVYYRGAWVKENDLKGIKKAEQRAVQSMYNGKR